MGAKSVVRDVGRVMGLSYGECDRLAKMIPNDLKMTLEKALKAIARTQAGLRQRGGHARVDRHRVCARRLTRNASVHAAGVVIGDQPLVNLLPLKQDEDGAIVTQYAMGPVGDLGLLKMDFLGLKTLTVIRNTCEMVRRPRASRCPSTALPLDDPDLRPAEQGQYARRVPVGIRRHARSLPEVPDQPRSSTSRR
jgi:DNA polymerase III subunit alpha